MIPLSPSTESFAVSIPTSETESLLHKLHELQETNKTLRTIIQCLEKNQPVWKAIYLAIGRFLNRHIKWILALPNLIATFFWLSMLIYFMVWYLVLPLDEKDRHPKICESFSLWPYISCIGEKRLPVFRAVCITMAVLITTSFVLVCHLGRRIAPGLWLKRAAAFFAILSSAALVTLSFKSIDEAPTAHLVSTSVQIFAMGNTKFFDWMSNSMVRKAFRGRIGAGRRIRPLEVSRWLKTCVAAFAAGKLQTTYQAVAFADS